MDAVPLNRSERQGTAGLLCVVPEGGLCNRMRTIASAALLAQRRGRRLQIDWYRTPDFNSAFDSLFEPIPGTTLVDRTAMTKLGKIGIRMREGLRRVQGWNVHVLDDPERVKDLVARFDLAGPLPSRVHLRSSYRLLTEPGMYAMFRPTAQVRALIEPHAGRLRHSVGVHIRRTDNQQAIERSPLHRFVELMAEELQADPGVHFFVATDEPAVMEELVRHFGDRVWVHPKRSCRRDDPRALVDAAVDLYGLSGCRKLIGSYWSSFSQTAWEIRGIDHVIVGE